MSQPNENDRPSAAILVFDIETVPDGPLLLEKAQAKGKMRDSADHRSAWNDLDQTTEALKALEYDFPPHIYHAVVSICAVFVHPETYAIIDGAKLTVPAGLAYADFLKAEADILGKFWSFSRKHASVHKVWYDRLESEYRLSDYQRRKLKPMPVTFCGYNITGFDLPVIEQRSLRHLLTCPIPEYAKDTGYDSYRSRYAYEKTYDLLQFIGATGGSGSRVGLDAIARAMGLGGKMQGMEGSKVAEVYFSERDAARIEDYCAVDVLVTYGVLLGIQKFRGILDEKSFSLAVSQFRTFLLTDGKPQTYRELEAHSAEFFQRGF
jgi:predicted PolB exonuclease-like 3'-5' exonuclease